MTLKTLRCTAIAIAGALLIGACGKSDDAPDRSDLAGGLLAYVPADTPYVAVQNPLPDDVWDALEPRFDRILRSYGDVLRQQVLVEASANEGDAADEDVAKMAAAGESLADLLSIDGMRGVGIGRESSIVLYGNGLLPVLRISLSDAALMEARIAEFEGIAGAAMQRASVDDIDYRYVGEDDAKLVVALIENDLVVSLLPERHSEELLKSVLGLTKPANSMADSEELVQLAEGHGYLDTMVAMLDMTRLAATFVDEQAGANRELLALADYDVAQVSDVCRAEIREVAQMAPLMHAGYSKFDVSGTEAKFAVDLREDLAAGLSMLASPVQGLGTVSGGLLSFGMSLDLLAGREFYAARLDAMEADPFECEHFADWQAGVEQGRAALQQPLPPIAYSVKGFLAVIDALEGFDVETKMPPTSVDASVLLAVDNPTGLIAMGAMFSPELANLNLQPDGKPLRLEIAAIPPAMGDAWIVMTDKSLAVAIGDDGESKLASLLDADYASPAPVMSLDMDAAGYAEIVGESIGSDPQMTGDLQAVADAAEEALASFNELVGRQTLDMVFTPKGLELRSTMTFKPAGN